MLAGPEGHSREGRGTWCLRKKSWLAVKSFPGVIKIKEAPAARLKAGPCQCQHVAEEGLRSISISHNILLDKISSPKCPAHSQITAWSGG